jgi:two-component system response regulator FixJ
VDGREVYLIGDDAPARRAVASLLRDAGFAARAYDTGAAFLEDSRQLPPGCVIALLKTAGMDGFELLRRLKADHAPYPVIILASDTGVSQAVEAMKAGAVDFIETPCGDEMLLEAVRLALHAEARASLHVARRRRHRSALATLTPRERDVLAGVIDGKTSKMIARECGISPRTVEVHRANLMLKSGARSVSELVRMALIAEPDNAHDLAA